MSDNSIFLNVESFSYRQEIGRKLLHISSLWMPCAVYFLEWRGAVALFGVGLLSMLAFEILRRWQYRLSVFLNRCCEPIMRPAENARSVRLTGATHMLAAGLILTVFFPMPVAVTALTILLLADTAAALTGRRFGSWRFRGKSLEGAAAFLITGVVSVVLLMQLTGWPPSFLLAGLCACLTATLAEFLSPYLRVDDNLSITLTAAVTMVLGS
jgi:phytol kinase